MSKTKWNTSNPFHRRIELDLSDARRVIYGLYPPSKDGFATYYDFVGHPSAEPSGRREGVDYNTLPKMRDIVPRSFPHS